MLMPKTQSPCTGAKLNRSYRVLDEIEKNNFIVLPGKGGPSELLPLRTVCPHIEGLGKELYSSSSRAILLIRLGCAQSLHPLIWPQVISLMSFSGPFNLASSGLLWSEEFYIFHGVGVVGAGCSIKRLPWWLRCKKICLQCGRPRFHSSIRKIPWRRKWQPTPVFLPGEAHKLRSLEGYSALFCVCLEMEPGPRLSYCFWLLLPVYVFPPFPD